MISQFSCQNHGCRCRLKGIHSRSDTNRTGAKGLSFYCPRLLHCLNQMLDEPHEAREPQFAHRWYIIYKTLYLFYSKPSTLLLVFGRKHHRHHHHYHFLKSFVSIFILLTRSKRRRGYTYGKQLPRPTSGDAEILLFDRNLID